MKDNIEIRDKLIKEIISAQNNDFPSEQEKNNIKILKT